MKLGEREMAAYCVLRGIDYQVEECPMAEGNRHLGLKETLNALEDRVAGHEGGVPQRVLRAGATTRSPTTADDERDELAPCVECGAPTTGRALRVLPRSAARSAPTPPASRRRPRCPSEVPGGRGHGGGSAMAAGRSRAGEQVLLIDRKRRRHLITLAEGGEFHTHAGVLDHDRHHRPRRGHHRPHQPQRGA